MLSKCGHNRCSSHVFLIYKDKKGDYVIICQLCYTHQPLDQLRKGNVLLEKIKKK